MAVLTARALVVGCLLYSCLLQTVHSAQAKARKLRAPAADSDGAVSGALGFYGDEPALKKDVRLIVLKLDRTGSSFLGYQLNGLQEDSLCALLGDTPVKSSRPGKRRRAWIRAELLQKDYGEDVTAEDQLLRIKQQLGYPEVCGEDSKDCPVKRECGNGATFRGFTLSPVKDQDAAREQRLFLLLSEYIASLAPEDRPIVWVHTRENTVRQALSGHKAIYMSTHRICPGVSKYHMDPALCPEAMKPVPISPQELEHLVRQRMEYREDTWRHALRLAGAASGLSASQASDWAAQADTGAIMYGDGESSVEGGGGGGYSSWEAAPFAALLCDDPGMPCRWDGPGGGGYGLGGGDGEGSGLFVEEEVVEGEGEEEVEGQEFMEEEGEEEEQEEGVEGGHIRLAHTTYEFITADRENGPRVLASLVGGAAQAGDQSMDNMAMQVSLAEEGPSKHSPRSSPQNTRDTVENFDALLLHAATEPEGSLWRGPKGIVAMLCQGVDPPCSSEALELTL